MKTKSILSIPQPKVNARIRLVCFPYAGGNTSLFFPWLNQMPEDVEIAILQLPGRGLRFTDPLFDSMDAIVEDVCLALEELSPMKLIFFGHSMGARIAYEVIFRLHHQCKPLPIHFFASASPAPCVKYKKAFSHNLPDAAFIAHLGTLNGTPKEVLADTQLMELLLPVLRADFKIVETYLNTTQLTLPTTVTGFAGKLDDIDIADIEPWFSLFKKNKGIVWFDGGHFFINENRDDVITSLKDEIINHLKSFDELR